MNSEVVSIVNGKVQGKIVQLKDGKPVHAFRNIPFAKPPVGSLRFMPPQPAEPWSGVKNATKAGNVPVYSTIMDAMMMKYFPVPDPFGSEQVLDEDCLHVSVFTPNPEKGKNLPVMVWLYGGGFGMGSERIYDGTVLAGMNDVVIVVPNYRVGVLGFLSLGPDSVCTGNAGLMDQQLALKWVQENIEFFGGNKENVTIFGESAGGISVNHQIISPLARGLFHKAISHSGQSTMPVLFRTPEENAESNKMYFEQLKITGKSDVETLEALQKIPANELIDAVNKLAEKRMSFYPCLDGKVFTKTPEQALKDKDFTKVPYIVGCNNTEGQGLLQLIMAPEKFMNGLTEEEMKMLLFVPLTDEGLQKCKEFYIKDNSDEKRFSKLIGNIMGDTMFVAKAVQTASIYADEGAPIYFYLGAFQLKMFQSSESGQEVAKKPDWCICDHGDDIMMTFGMPFSPYPLIPKAKFTKEEEEISRTFMTYLTNFARSGDPNEGKPVNTKWPKYKRNGEHLVVNTPFSVGKNLGEKEAEFWNNVMYQYIKTGDKKE